MSLSLGKLYGVGVGPGAPDLVTLRATRILNTVDVIAIPKSSDYSKPVAWRIVSPVLKSENPNQEHLFLRFPMTRDPEILKPAWDIAFSEIENRLKKGLNVAFITEGDPLVYSTFSYLLENIQKEIPCLEVEIVPAVSSVTAVPSVLQIPIADGQERFAVLPALYGIDDLPKLVNEFDTILLTKVSSCMPELVSRLEELDLLHKAVYVSKATTEDQKIIRDLRAIKNDRCDYFSMVMISIRKRKGILRGHSDQAKQ